MATRQLSLTAGPDPREYAERAALRSVADAAREHAAELVVAFDDPPTGARLLADLAAALDRFAVGGGHLRRGPGRSFLRVLP